MSYLKSTIVIGTAVLLTGCASGYQQFYKPVANITPEKISQRRASPPPSTPAIERVHGPADQAFLDRYLRRAMVPIGYANFTSGRRENEESALKQGRDVGADLVVVLDPKYVGSSTTSVPITTPTSTTSYTNGTATAYGSRGGAVTINGNATTTTYGTQTTYIPITIDHAGYGAVYFIKQKTSLGIVYRDLTDEERDRLQTNKGMVARLIIDGSPAFEADILVGDIITSFDGRSVSNVAAFELMIGELRGRTVTVKFIRAGQPMEKIIRLNS